MRKLVLTVNEIRAEEGYQAMDGPIGDAPVNPSLIQPWLQVNLPDAADQESPQQTPRQSPDTADESGQRPVEAQGIAGREDSGAASTPQFGDEARTPDFGKAFGLPPVFALDEV